MSATEHKFRPAVLGSLAPERLFRRLPEEIRKGLERPAAVLGGGVSGQAAVGLLHHLGAEVTVYDEKSGVAWEGDALAPDGLVVVSPGFRVDHPWLEAAREAGMIVLSELDLGFLVWPGQVWAVTGTNGKSTLVQVLADAVTRQGGSAVACGNNGFPFASAAMRSYSAEAVAVCEVSSFQAEHNRYFAPDAVLWTNLQEDHLDRHSTMAGYFDAKFRLVSALRGSVCVVGESVAQIAGEVGRRLPPGVQIVPEDAPHGVGIPESSAFARPPQRGNLGLALAFWERLGRERGSLLEAAAALSSLPHRLALVEEIAERRFWNDSKATNPEGARAAIRSFDRPVLWLGGGRNKGSDLARVARDLAPLVRGAFLFGEAGTELARVWPGSSPVIAKKTLAEAFAAAWEVSEPGDEVVLSPGFASQDAFAGFAARGEAFVELVSRLRAEVSGSTVSSCSDGSP